MSDLDEPVIYQFSGYTLNLKRRSLSRGELDVALAPKEFQTLVLLVQAAGQAVHRETLVSRVWPDTVVGDTSLARNISSLRRHLGAEAIAVVPKYGYRFSLPVTVVEPAGPPPGNVTPMPGPDIPLVENAGRTTATEWGSSAARWGWVAVALLIAVSAVGLLAFLRQKAVAEARGRSSMWTDPQTGLIWTTKDNGGDVTRQQAIDYCSRLEWRGQRGWRLPTIAEVQTLYDPSISIPGVWGPTRAVYWHVKGNIYLTGGTAASDLTSDGSQEQSFDFSYGRRNFDAPDFHADHRALCVRP